MSKDTVKDRCKAHFKEERMLAAINPSVNSFPVNIYDKPASGRSGEKNPLSQDGARPQGAQPARLSTQYYQADSLSMTFTNKDGDTVSLSMERVEYREAMLEVSQEPGAGDGQDDWGRIVAQIKDEYRQLKQDMIDQFVEGITGKKKAEKDTAEGDDAKPVEDAGIAGLPEYWNAENTSQRIVDFATSFLSAFEGAGEDFVKMIRDAIEDGFSQASDLMGELPDAVGRLVGDTHELVMKKLDAWAEAQGFSGQPQAQDADTGASA
jgi:hypothetical protein